MRQQQYHCLHACKIVLARITQYIGDVLHTSLLLQQVDNRHQKEPLITSEQAKRICDRNFGVGGDGVRDFPAVPVFFPCSIALLLHATQVQSKHFAERALGIFTCCSH